MFPLDIFDALDAEVAAMLGPYGFKITRRDRCGPFNSYHSEYKRAGSVIWLVWDGKESCLWLSFRTCFFWRELSEKDLYLCRFPHMAIEKSKYATGASETLSALREYLVSPNNSFQPNPLRGFKTPSGFSGGSA